LEPTKGRAVASGNPRGSTLIMSKIIKCKKMKWQAGDRASKKEGKSSKLTTQGFMENQITQMLM